MESESIKWWSETPGETPLPSDRIVALMDPLVEPLLDPVGEGRELRSVLFLYLSLRLQKSLLISSWKTFEHILSGSLFKYLAIIFEIILFYF